MVQTQRIILYFPFSSFKFTKIRNYKTDETYWPDKNMREW